MNIQGVLCMLYSIILSVYQSHSQSTSGSDCTYTFTVTRSQQPICPGSDVMTEDEGLTRAQLAALVTNQQQQLALLTNSFNEMTSNFNELTSNFNELNEINYEIKQENIAMRERLDTLETEGPSAPSGGQAVGTNYIRWGRTECPNTAVEIYQGYAASSWYDHFSGGSDYLCLHSDPQHPDGAQTGYQHLSYIYGVEYGGVGIIDPALQNHDAMCVVCGVSVRSQMLMIPGRETCDDGWTLEYSGVLASSYSAHKKSTAFVCLDGDPETRSGGAADQNGGVFSIVETQCGSLPCPPFVSGYEVSCVVCTK